VILRYGYAIEYDALAPGQFRKTLESRVVKGLYTAGQLNGTSGDEEAAAQGLIAGINAVLSLRGMQPYWPSRTQSYIGVLVDDLSTWEKPEPYRITPGHAEFRLKLRDDSAERRLIEDAARIGLIGEQRYQKIKEWVGRIEDEMKRLEGLKIQPSGENRARLLQTQTGDLKKTISAAELLQRPSFTYSQLKEFFPEEEQLRLSAADEVFNLETEIRYRGYAEREAERIEQTRLLEKITLPLADSDKRLQALSETARQAIFSSRFDDLSQAVRKNCLSRGELAILLTVLDLKEEVSGKTEVEQ